VLGLWIAIFVFITAAPQEPWAEGALVLLLCAALLAALWTAGMGQDRRPAIPLAAAAIAAAISVQVFEGDTATGIVATLDAVLAVFVIAVVGLGVIDQRDVNAQSVTGAICIYLFLGLFFTFVFSAVAAFGDRPFFANGSDGTWFDRMYFSYVTLATLGYGDYTASGDFGRSLAIVELLMGQLYLVTAVALLVGTLVASRRNADDDVP
jgi:hypothetical protein